MFANKVVEYLNSNGGTVCVPNFRRKKAYKMQLTGAEVKVFDSDNVPPIPLTAFDKVEECLKNGIHKPGNGHHRLGDPELDENTIMYHIGMDIFGKSIGDSISDNACYIYALLEAAECIIRKRGNISIR